MVGRTARTSRGDDLFEAAYDWGTLRVLRYLSTRGDARYTLLDAAGVALNIGPGLRVFLKEDKQALGITSVVRIRRPYGPTPTGSTRTSWKARA
ncbi:hypothetical protein J7E97_29800 [Streptomyces sp. ISL-66]|uniref:hypothetical protein n=1 Tax=Streptomyces sp. ISL-66 TaxID=2819186 RepID=UPI001BE5D947|nr:hypothetical protein [Streptomyces sp. ISL-66]MBT2471940.1 hypothetical protein [Streptomyces sp. ISL-66]